MDVPIASTAAQHSAGRKCCSIQAPSSMSAQINAYRAIFWETEASKLDTLNLSRGIQLSIQAFILAMMVSETAAAAL